MLNNTVKSFVTGFRAASLAEYLAKNNINSRVTQERWTNKKLPPPPFVVCVSETDANRAKELAAEKGTW